MTYKRLELVLLALLAVAALLLGIQSSLRPAAVTARQVETFPVALEDAIAWNMCKSEREFATERGTSIVIRCETPSAAYLVVILSPWDGPMRVQKVVLIPTKVLTTPTPPRARGISP